ncbi:MAG TPA: hypothetical protein VD788_09050 [Candidatus Polarisedimenticolaceae bacterium]|nr:hypothetical protein [Candidatus Polarisedimenticolaceae bacterium]
MMHERQSKETWLVLALALPLIAVGCAGEPAAEIDAASAALESARLAEAEVYAPEAMQTAEAAHAELQTELAAQKERFALGRSYDKTRELAADAQRASEEAVGAAHAGKLMAREEAMNMLAELRTSLDEVETMLDNAPQGKGSAADLAALRGDLGAVDVALTDIEQAISAQRFIDAVQKAQAAMASTAEIRSEIERAQEAQRAAKSRRG